MIIGLVGLFASGKDTVATYLEKDKGFRHISLSNILREEARKREIDLTLENLMNFAIELKREKGPNILAVLARNNMTNDTVISSIRMAEEIEYLKQIPNFFTIEINGGPVKNRYKRFVDRDREDSKDIDFKKFVEMENQQIKGNGGQALGRVLKMKDFTLDNTSTFKKLYKEIDTLLDKLEKKSTKKYKRPSWDEYFLRLIEIIGERGTCDRGRSGAVIVKDKRVIATGYVGSPAGMPHCDEVGHLFKQTVHEDGTVSNHCVRTIHAEQNAIIQAARHGIQLEGSTLYCRMEPCAVCAKLIANAGITRVVSLNQYHTADETHLVFKQCGVKLDVINKRTEKYKKQ